MGRLGPTELITLLAWAPSGKSFLVVTQDYIHNTTLVRTISSNGSVLHVLSKTDGIPSFPPPVGGWSPDGAQLAFTETPPLNREGQGRQTAVVANADGSTPHTVDSATGVVQLGLCWSPDGRSIVTADGDRVRVVHADGTQAKVIAYPGDGHELDDAAWQPLSLGSD